MKWTIPAKTFLVGEYVALSGGPAIVLTTSPCFEITLTDHAGLQGIHPESPAGRWWAQHDIQHAGLEWHDPYQGCGGMGASSAQFLGAYYASQYVESVIVSTSSPEQRSNSLIKQAIDQDKMLDAYFQVAWQGVGVSPSGYDVLAQSMFGCVYLNRQKASYQTYVWPFQDLAFILIHTGEKLITHHHLHDLNRLDGIDVLEGIVESARMAFDQNNSTQLVAAVRAYHEQLLVMNLVAAHSVQAIELLKQQQDILAVKGCGALGADVLLLLVPALSLAQQVQKLSDRGAVILATSRDSPGDLL
ncbi:MAG: hypothetical protein Q8R24_04560 [Legionellaceae bacterium]|nr:hypothetical protein [Legionellaceae bacterium]